MKAKEISKELTFNDLPDLMNKLATLVHSANPKLSRNEIMSDIKKRNELGEGLMTPITLSVHVQDKRVNSDIVYYLNLSKTFKYYSKVLKNNFNISKLVVIVVNPKHDIAHLKKLQQFIQDNS